MENECYPAILAERISMGNKRIEKNYIYNVSYRVLLIIASLITAPYLSRVLGADNIGRYSYVNSIVSYFVLFATLGITTYGRREISYVQEDREKRSIVFWETKLLQLFTSGIAMSFYLLFAFFQNDKLFYLVFVLNIMAVSADVTWLFQGMEEFGRIVFRNTTFKLLNILYIFLFVKKKDDLLLYAFGITAFSLLSNASLWTGLARYIDKPKWRNLRPFRDIRTVLSLFVPTIAIEIYTVLDRTMIGVITKDSFENGYYEQAIKISKLMLSIVTALGPVLIPRIGYYFQKGDTEKQKIIMYRGYQFVWFLGIPLCLGLGGLSYNFVPWFFGKGFDKVSPLLCVLSALILAIGINNLTGAQYLIPTKRQNVFTFTVLIGALINFSLNVFLIPLLQSIGAAIASVAAETAIALIQLYLVRKELDVKKVFLCSCHYWIAGLIMLIVLLIEKRFLGSTTWNICAMVGSGAATYFAILFMMRDEFLIHDVRSIITGLTKSRK